MSSSAMAAGDPPLRPLGSYWTDHSGWITMDDLTFNSGHVGSVLTSDGDALSWEPYDPELTVTPEELKIRRENTLVRELYEQYKVALILASDNE